MVAGCGLGIHSMAAPAGNVLTSFLLPDSLRRPPEEEIQALEDDLQGLRTSVMSLSKEENPTFTHKCLTNQFRELSYDAEDYLEMLRHSGGGCWQINWILCKTKQHPHLSAKDISELRSRAKDAGEIWLAYHQPASSRTTTENSCWSCRLQAEPTQRISISSESLEPKGLDDPTNELVRMLAFDSNQLQLKVVSVHGSAGVGKTTLTRRLYHYYKGRFHYGAFLRVSRKADTKRLLASLLLQIKGRQCKYRAFVDDQEDLINNIKQHLHGKSYLIVIDDLWDTSEWDILSRAFPRDNFCSRIITTTQVKAVALTCCNDHTEHILNMRPLDDAESIELFNSTVNHIVGYNAEECKEVSYEIIRKFGGGLPLAIINISGMLGGWPDIQMNELNYVKSFLFSALAANPSYERMEGVLTLVYNILPPKLKTCLLYLSMFPEYYVIRKDDLVRQWVAEGILREVHPQDEELTGNVYFDELQNRGLIQSADTDYNNQLSSCTVHHTVRDFIAQKAVQENFITVVDHHETVAGLLDNKVRRLSVRFGGVKCAKIPESLRISQVRSLRFSGFFKCVPSLVEYWLLRVLVLHIWSDRHKRILDLSIISDLIQLRYVRVKCNMIVKLPSMIRGLQYLQTLDVNARVAAVPVDFFCLPHLLHLRIPSECFLSFWSGHMLLLPCLNKLIYLLDIHLTCSAKVPSSRIVSNIKCLSSILGKFVCLKSLILDGEAPSDGSIISCDSLSSVAYPRPSLERLVLSPRIFMMSRLPNWIGDLRNNLCTLKIALRGLSDNDVGTLQGLHQLAALSLYVRTIHEERIIFNRGFLVLKYFKFVCTAPCLKFEKETMPIVETLKLRFSANTMQQYSLVHAGFEHLMVLKLFCAKIGDAGADQPSREGAKRQMVSAFSKHTHPPVINVQLLESSIYNETEQNATDVVKRGFRENDSMEDINRTPDRSRIIASPEYSPRMHKPGWVCRRPSNGVHLGKTVRGFTYVVRQHMKQPGFRLTNEVATLDQDMERLKMITDISSPGSQPQEWVLQVQDLIHDIQDFIDIYSWLRTRSRRQTIAHMSHIVQLKDRIRTTQEWQQSGMLSHGRLSGSRASSGPSRSRRYGDEDVLVGIEVPINEILELLLLPEDVMKAIIEPVRMSSAEEESVTELILSPTERLKPRVVSIVGYPGIGKTALARAVYNHPRVRTAFNTCVAWIGASECSNSVDLQNKILEQVESFIQGTTLEGILRNERFLVIIDGLQEAGTWYGIQSVFPKTHHGSRIIITTSIQSVATACSPEGRYIYRMQGLDYLASENLFWTRVSSRTNRTPALEYTLGDTLRKCGGLPLAVISVANHFCKKYQNLPHRSSGGFEEMNRALTQCYDSLPDNDHRMCLLSLSTFPQGHLIKRKMVIRKWVADGLVHGDGELNPEQVASNIFDVLIDRNIIEPVLIGNNSKAKGCLVLGVIKDFIINKSVLKEFAAIISNDELLFPNKKIAHPVRRLFVHAGTAHSQRVAKGIVLDRVRSLTICNTVPFDDFQGCCLLRVLDLEACQGVHMRVLHNICKLVFLKYLSLRGSDVHMISKKIKKLQCLEMLDIRETRVKTLPIEVFMLPRLAHLFGKFELPRQLKDRMFRSKLQAFFSEKSRLQTLSGFVMVGNNEFEHIILKTRLLRKVKLWCNHTITPSFQKHIRSSIQELLKGKNALESLSIDFGNGSINFLNDIGAPYALISSLKLRGRLISMPTFMTSHDTTLSQLELSSTRLSIEALSLLQCLRQLSFLKLVDGDGFWGDCFIVQRDGFPSLLRLCFEARQLPQVHIHEGGMSSLTCLQLLCPAFASCNHSDCGESPIGSGVQPGEKLKVVHPDPEISFKEIGLEINSVKIEETDSKKEPTESFRETLFGENTRNYPEKLKKRFDLKKHFRGIEHLQHLSELVLHHSVCPEVFDAWKKEARSHINRPKVTSRVSGTSVLFLNRGSGTMTVEKAGQCANTLSVISRDSEITTQEKAGRHGSGTTTQDKAGFADETPGKEIKEKEEEEKEEPEETTLEVHAGIFGIGRADILVAKEEEIESLEQEHEMIDEKLDTALSIQDVNNEADTRLPTSKEAKGKQEAMVLEEEPDRIEETDGNNSKVGQGDGPNRDWTIRFDEGWAFVQQGINKFKNILEGRPEPQFTSEEHIKLYTKVYHMCWEKPQRLFEVKLYDKYRETFEEYLTSEVLPSLREKHGEFVLRELVKRWNNNTDMARWMSHVFYALDKYYVHLQSLPPLKEVAITCFRELVYQDIKGQVKDIVLELMQHEREGGHIDRDLLRNVLTIFVEIGINSREYYEDDIEMHLLKNTEDYYFVKAQSWIHGTACSDYLIKAEQYLKREQARDYLFGNTKELLLEKVQYELLGRYGDQILENEHDGFNALLHDEKVEHLSRMYRLFSNVSPCVVHMSTMFKKYIKTEGTALVEQEEDCCSNKKPEKQGQGGMQEQAFVWKLVELHEKYATYVTECFQRDDLFHKALRHAFVFFCNMGVSGISNAEILSTFFDNFLTKDCSKKIGDEDIEDALKKVVRLLVHIQDRDLFATFYRQKLARRLLEKIANDEHERIMFRLLKELFGGQFTSKMEGMAADIIVRTEHQTGFKEYLNKHPELDPSINMAVSVLTMGFWPSYKNIDMTLPADMAKCVEVFEKSYKERMSGRTLNWMYSMGSCNIDAKFGAKSIELIVTPCQAALLLLFNGCDRLSYSEIVTELSLPDDDFAKHLLSSVSCAKCKILNKYPNNTTISSSDVFEFNSEFNDRKRRVKIPVPHGVEKKKVVEEINMDRRYKIEASIVRIMKSRRVMGHTQLVTECVEQLSLLFKPDVPSIKKGIEDLIHRDYMKRDEKNPNIYEYEGSWAEPEDTNERGQINELKK